MRELSKSWRSPWVLAAGLAVLAVSAYSLLLFPRSKTTEGAIAQDDARAISSFRQRVEAEEALERWSLKIGKSTVTVEKDDGRVVRRDAGGQVEWATQVTDLDSWWWPSLRTDKERIFVKRQFKGIVGLNAASGNVLWRAEVPSECFWLDGNLLLLADGKLVVGLAAETGAEVFRILLPTDRYFRPVAITEAAGLFLVQTAEDAGGNGDAFLIDRGGQIRHHFPCQVVDVVRAGRDRVFLTSKDLRRLTPEDRTVWTVPFEQPEWIAGGKILRAADGDLIAFLHCRIANSGVELMRLNPDSGKKGWQAWCGGLPGVVHSEYKHDVDVELMEPRVRVISLGSAGSFVEWLDGQTGKQLRRGESSADVFRALKESD